MVGGLEDRVVRNEEPALVWALVTETAAFLITTNIEQPRLAAEEDLAGFELHAVPWYSSGGLREVAESLADGGGGGRGGGGRGRGGGGGGPIGYLSREFDVVPGTPGAAEIIAADTAFAWNPTIRGAKSEDTFVVGRAGAVPVTNTADWPVTVAGRPSSCLFSERFRVMPNESSPGLRPRSVGLRGNWVASITNVAPTAATTLTMAALIAASGLASPLALLIPGAAMLCCGAARGAGERGRRAAVPAAGRRHGGARRVRGVLDRRGRPFRPRTDPARGQRPAGVAGTAPDARIAGTGGV